MALTSCDSLIATSLEGTWEGDMYVSTYYGNREYYSNRTQIEFARDPYYYSAGRGYWVDYYDYGAPWDYDYLAYHFDWSVENQVIYIHFLEDNYHAEIHDYHLDDDRFIGYIWYGNEKRRFTLYHTYSPRWDDFCYYDWNDYYGYPYYSPAAPSAESDTLTHPAPLRPVRGVRPEGVEVK